MPHTYRLPHLRLIFLIGLCCCFAVLTGCATNANRVAYDPIEPFNRGMYKFNGAVDAAFVHPIATVYNKATPRFAKKGVRNFFGNLSDAWSTVNSILQFKGKQAGNSFFRVMVNTLFGLGGIIDVASEAQIPKSRQDFGLTLRRWGVPAGPYLVLPFVGPSTVRDAIALPVDMKGNPLGAITHNATRNSLVGLNFLSQRAEIEDAAKLVKQSGMDPYVFMRDAYLKQRGVDIASGGDTDVTTGGYIPPLEDEEFDDEAANTSSSSTSDDAAQSASEIPSQASDTAASSGQQDDPQDTSTPLYAPQIPATLNHIHPGLGNNFWKY